MATNVLRGKSRGTKPPEDKGLAIGETDAHVFNCPACARPLSNGTSACPGCGARLIMGVTLRRALAILVLGMVARDARSAVSRPSSAIDPVTARAAGRRDRRRVRGARRVAAAASAAPASRPPVVGAPRRRPSPP